MKYKTPLQHINALAENYAKERAQSATLNDKIAYAFIAFHTEINNNPKHFMKPRTFIAHGFKIRCRSQRGRIVINTTYAK
jgi:ribosomal protein L34